MAMTDTYIQPDGGISADERFSLTIEVKKKGDYATLMDEAGELKQYDPIEDADGWLVRSWRLDKLPGGLGELTITGVQDDGETYDDDTAMPKPYKVTWSVKTVRNDVSVMAYCGEKKCENPNRVNVEKWLAEKDADVARKGTFRQKDGTEFDMEHDDPATFALIKKMLKGVEAVIRFYPVVTRRKFYHRPPGDVLEDLGFINDPPSPDGTDLTPGKLGQKFSLYEWLKCQDDCDQQTDGDWIRTESWMGILKDRGPNAEPPWDPDLYGPSRWTMPAYPNGNGGNNGGNNQ